VAINAKGTRRLPASCDALRVAAKFCDVPLDPFEGIALVKKRIVAPAFAV